VKRPADCLEEARYVAGEEARPDLLATADQLNAQSAEMLRFMQEAKSLSHSAWLPDNEITHAFKLAAGYAFFERMQEPRGLMCPHLIDLTIPHIVDLTGGWAACRECVYTFAPIEPWSSNHCDVCGQSPTNNRFTPYAFNLGAAIASAHICGECVAFLEQARD
jgi:hypothetical protein